MQQENWKSIRKSKDKRKSGSRRGRENVKVAMEEEGKKVTVVANVTFTLM